MDNKLIETGKIINTHGIRGEVKIEPWANTPESLLDYDTFFIDGVEFTVMKARVQKRFVFAVLDGINSIEDAERLKGKVIFVDRDDMELDEGEYLISDLVGFEAMDAESGTSLGKITDILTLPGGDVCEIHGEREILVPLRPEFLDKIDSDENRVFFRLIEGM